MEEFLKQILLSRKPSHAYLFFGPGDSEKEETATLFASSLLCRNSGETACGSCVSCKKINSGNHPDFRVILPEGDKVKIEQIRPLKGEMQFGPLESPWKIYLLTRCESMTEAAAQSLLKILEEPPRQIILMLIAPHPSAILPTLASRCQWISVRSPGFSERKSSLISSGIPDEYAAPLAGLQISSSETAGWMRSLKEIPANFFSATTHPFEIFERGILLEDYKDADKPLIGLMLAFYRDVMVLKAGWHEGVLLSKFREEAEKAASSLSWDQIAKRIQAIQEAGNFLEKSGNFKLVTDTLLYKLNA